MFMIGKTLTEEQRLQKAVVDIMANPKYIALAGILMIGDRRIDDDAENCPTAYTNGKDERYGRAFVAKLNDAELRFLILHECYHKLYRHLTTWRWMYNEHPQAANMACVVGDTLIAMGDGTVRNAESVRAGDMVATPFGVMPVLATKSKLSSNYCELVMDNGYKLCCTADHKILTERGYVAAEDLTETDAIFVDSRHGHVLARKPRHHADKGHGPSFGSDSTRRVSSHACAGDSLGPDDGEAAIIKGLGSLAAYGLGVLRWARGRGGDSKLSTISGEVPTAHAVRHQYEFVLDELVQLAGSILGAGPQQLRQLVLEGGSEWVWDSSSAGRHAPVRKDQGTAVRHFDGDHQNPHGSWLQVPADADHHLALTRTERAEHARLATRRFITESRTVFDITTPAQCFIAEGVIVHNCDYVINIKLVDDNKDGFATMTGALTMGCFDLKYRGWDSAKVFKDLKQGGQGGQGKGQGQGTGFDDHGWDEAQDMTPSERSELAREIDEAIRQGALMAGKVGSGGDRDLEALMQPQIDWREVLRDFITSTCAGNDYSTWRRPNRRYIGAGVYLPSGISERIGEIVVAIDTSGSIGGPQLSAFLSEVKAIAETVNPDAVRVLYWDTAVCGDEVYVGDEVQRLVQSTKPKGGGGTMVECVPRYLQDKQIKAQCVIVLTDGYLGGSWGQWNHPVLWTILDNKSAVPDCGQAVHIKGGDM